MDFGSNGFMLICAALVFIMTPGLAFFYGGLARKKNIVDTMMASVGLMGMAVVMWICFGYSVTFSGDGPIIGDLQHAFLIGLSPHDLYNGPGSISIYSFVAFQMMFAMITPAVVTGAGVGRMRYRAMFLFSAIWSVLVYYPLAHMVWGNGFLQKMGVIDFAGGFPIEVTTGISGLVLAAMLGKREGFGTKSFEPHNKPYVFLGASILWFGWLGFNAGSSFLADGLASHAFMTTMLIAASALLSWMIVDIITQGKPTIVGASSGLVCGLVAATPTCGLVPLWSCFIIGGAVSPICYAVTNFVLKRKIFDDPMSVLGCHGMAGITGSVGLAFFCHPACNPAADFFPGLAFGDGRQFAVQMAALGITAGFAAGMTAISVLITRIFTKLRVEPEAEVIGLDISEHNEDAYPAFEYHKED